jgi:hypothetical protein
MYSDFLEDSKILSLAFEDQRHFIAVLALKSRGVLDQDCDERLMNRIVAQRLWIAHDAIEDVKRRLIEAGLIAEDWQPLAWEKRQFSSDKDPTGAERQRRFKENMRVRADNAHGNALGNGQVTVAVTLPDTDTDTDIEEVAKATMSRTADAAQDQSADEVETKKKKTKPDNCPHQEIVTLYNELLPELPHEIPSRWRGSTGEASLRTRWREDKRHQNLDFWCRFFATVRTSKFWMGENDRGWRANLTWLLTRRRFDEVLQHMVEARIRTQPSAQESTCV